MKRLHIEQNNLFKFLKNSLILNKAFILQYNLDGNEFVLPLSKFSHPPVLDS